MNRASTLARKTADPDYFAAATRKRYALDPLPQIANATIQAGRRRARMDGLPATLTLAEWWETIAYFHGCCAYCLRPLDDLEREHMVPTTRGGGYTQENVVPACLPCNRAKGTKPIWSMV